MTRRPVRRRVLQTRGVLAFALLLNATTSRATEAPLTASKHVEFSFRVGLGQTTALEHEGDLEKKRLMTLGARFLPRVDLLRAGLEYDLGLTLFGHTEQHFGLTVGFSGEPLPRLQLALYGAYGLHRLDFIGEDLFKNANGKGESTLLTYAGFRLEAFRRFRSGGTLGVWVGRQFDLYHKTVHVDVESCLFGCTSEEVETFRVGGSLTTAGLELSF